MSKRLIPGAVVFLAVIGLSCANAPSPEPISRIEHQGLVVEFRAICVDGNIGLEGAISNTTNKTITIESGSPTWYYDFRGTEFSATSAGKTLVRDEGAPIMDRPGPLPLAPQERQVGMTPLWVMFPEIKQALAKEPVMVHWKYRLSVKSPEAMEGSLEIKRDPCAR